MAITTTFIICFLPLITSGDRVLPRNDHLDDDGIQIIFERLAMLESKLDQQTKENFQLRSSVASLRSEVSTMQNENRDLQNQIQALKSHDQTRAEETKDLQRQVSNLARRDQEHDEEIKELLDHMNEMKGSYETSIVRRARQIRKRENEKDVAFFSVITSHLFHMGVNQNIVFDRVITNVGNAYNNHAGDFRAPVDGTYVFSVTLMAYSTHSSHYSLVKNGTAAAYIYLRGHESPYASSGLTAVLELKQGEDVAIRNIDQDEALHGSAYSTFSGFLLTQDFSSPGLVGK